MAGETAMTNSKQRLHGVARSATKPVRDYINTHFEMTKDEIRRVAPHDEGLAQVVAELGNVIAETQLYHSRVVGDLRAQVEGLAERVERFERVVDQLTHVVGALTVVAEEQPPPPAS